MFLFRTKLKEEFLTPLLELISRINNSFGRYYASMKCAGEVSLYTGEGDVDVSNWLVVSQERLI